MKGNKYNDMLRGEIIFYNTGELSFETNPQNAGTFKGTYLEPVGKEHSKILTKDGKITVIHNNMISLY